MRFEIDRDHNLKFHTSTSLVSIQMPNVVDVCRIRKITPTRGQDTTNARQYSSPVLFVLNSIGPS
jgi:hypothetical protein